MDNLEEIINTINDETNQKNAFFEINANFTDNTEYYISANKDGLLLFAKEFIIAAKHYDIFEEPTDGSDGSKYYPFDDSRFWNNGDISIDFIEQNEADSLAIKNHITRFKGYLIPVGCILTFVITITFCIIGFITSLKWVL